jgi:hypothetical protein
VTNGTTQFDLMSKLFPRDTLVPSTEAGKTVESFAAGECQVYASGIVERTAKIIQDSLAGEYVVGTVPFTRESLALVTREEDVVFSKLVNAVVNAIIYADEQGITQENAADMPRVTLFSSLLDGDDEMFRNIIAAVGNYQEIWDRCTNPRGLQRKNSRNELNTFPLGPLLMPVHTWDKRPPTSNNR